jgi:putative Holliday junction resolvase
MRVLSIDFGTVRIGTALSDELKMLATPLKVIPYTKSAAEEIAALVAASDVDTVIIGMPYMLDGGESLMTVQTKNFAAKLRALIPCQVIEWDEAFSSRRAGERMRGAGMKKKKRQQKGTTDAWAAAIILQEYLDSLR